MPCPLLYLIATLSIPSRLLLLTAPAEHTGDAGYCNTLYTESSIATFVQDYTDLLHSTNCNTLYTESSIATHSAARDDSPLLRLQHSLYRVVYCYMENKNPSALFADIATLSIPSRLLLHDTHSDYERHWSYCNTLYTESSIATVSGNLQRDRSQDCNTLYTESSIATLSC